MYFCIRFFLSLCIGLIKHNIFVQYKKKRNPRKNVGMFILNTNLMTIIYLNTLKCPFSWFASTNYIHDSI